MLHTLGDRIGVQVVGDEVELVAPNSLVILEEEEVDWLLSDDLQHFILLNRGDVLFGYDTCESLRILLLIDRVHTTVLTSDHMGCFQ